jgi:hypothetical protein
MPYQQVSDMDIKTIREIHQNSEYWFRRRPSKRERMNLERSPLPFGFPS